MARDPKRLPPTSAPSSPDDILGAHPSPSHSLGLILAAPDRRTAGNVPHRFLANTRQPSQDQSIS